MGTSTCLGQDNSIKSRLIFGKYTTCMSDEKSSLLLFQALTCPANPGKLVKESMSQLLHEQGLPLGTKAEVLQFSLSICAPTIEWGNKQCSSSGPACCRLGQRSLEWLFPEGYSRVQISLVGGSYWRPTMNQKICLYPWSLILEKYILGLLWLWERKKKKKKKVYFWKNKFMR